MNYAIVAVGGLLMITAAAWVLWGRKHFSGPVKTFGRQDERGHSSSADVIDSKTM